MQKPNTKNRVREQWTTNELENYTKDANTKRTNASNIDKSMRFLALTPPVAWQAFPFGFGEKKDRGTTRKGIFGFGRAKNGTGAKKWNGGGEGRGRKGMLADKPRDFENPLASERGVWLAYLAWLVEYYWDVSIKSLFHTEMSWHA